MAFRACFRALLMAIATFCAISFSAPSEAVAHAGHHAGPASSQTVGHAPDDGHGDAVAISAESVEIVERLCLNVCCVGAHCCPTTLPAALDDDLAVPSAVKILGLRASPRPDPAAEPPREPPRTFV